MIGKSYSGQQLAGIKNGMQLGSPVVGSMELLLRMRPPASAAVVSHNGTSHKWSTAAQQLSGTGIKSMGRLTLASKSKASSQLFRTPSEAVFSTTL